MDEAEILPFAERYVLILKAYELKPNDLGNGIVGVAPAVWYKYQNGIKPGYDALEALLKFLPDLSADYLLRGVGPLRKTEMPITLGERPESPTPDGGVNWKDRYYDLKQKHAEVEKDYAILNEKVEQMGKYTGLLEHLYQKTDSSFPSASSHSTAMVDFDCILALYKDSVQQQMRESIRVRGLEPTKVREERILNSLESETLIRKLWQSAAMSA